MKLNNINETSFQARLDVSKVKANSTRWQSIAKKFSEKTSSLPGRLKVIEYEVDTSIIGPSKYEKLPEIGIFEAITFNTTIDKLFAKYDDDTIVKKLVKLLNIGTIADSRKEKMTSKYQAMMDKQSWVPKDKFQNKLDLECSIIEDIAKNKAYKDAFLKNFDIIL